MMKNSRMPDDWIARNIQRVPFQRLANGNIATCPVRLNFCNFWTPKKGQNDDGVTKESYSCAVLLPPGADAYVQSVLWPAWCEEARKAFPNNWRPDGQPFGLHWPVHPCDEKQQYAGYTPGCYYFNVSSQYQPRVTDTGLNPIVDPHRVYDGIWAVLALNLYPYKNKKTGVSFGLQNVMIVGDDERLTGGGSDPQADFGHVQIDAAYDPAAAFGSPAAGVMPPATSVAPGAPPPPMAAPGFAPPMPTSSYPGMTAPPPPPPAPAAAYGGLDYDPTA